MRGGLLLGGSAPRLESRLTWDVHRGRLHGFIDVQGVNKIDPEGINRRALVLNRQMGKRWQTERKQGPVSIEPSVVTSLLSRVHFVHGARSMEALLDMCGLVADGGRVGQEPQLRLRLDPKGEMAGIEPGMTVWIDR